MKKFLKIVLIILLVFLTLFGLYRVYQKNYYKGVYDLASYNILHKDEGKLDLEAYKELSRQSKTGDSIPNFYLTNPNEVLEYLKPYGIDEAWINEKSHFMLYDVVLERWFKNGSQRYSVDNLGDVEIVPLSFSE